MLILNKNKKTESDDFKKALGAINIPTQKKSEAIIFSDTETSFNAIKFVLESGISIYNEVVFVADFDSGHSASININLN